MPLRTGSSGTGTTSQAEDWAEAYKRRLALSTLAQRTATSLSNVSNPIRQSSAPTTSSVRSIGGLKGGTPLMSAFSGSTSGTGSTSGSRAAGGGGSTYTGSTGSAGGGGGSTIPGGGSTPNGNIPIPGGVTPPSGATPGVPNENAPNPGGPKDQSYNYDWKAAWGNGQGITSNSDWAKGISDTMLQTVLDDSQQTTAQWAQNRGYGQGLEGALNRYADPTALQMLGAQGAIGPTGAETAGFVGGFNEAATQATGGKLIDPKGVINRVLSASGDIARPDALGQRLYGGQNASNPAAQVADTLKFLQASLTGTMANSSLDAYLSMLERAGRNFLAWKSTPAGVTTATNFGKYILDQYGGNGGF